MEVRSIGGWLHYVRTNLTDYTVVESKKEIDKQEDGKWMHFFSDVDTAMSLCERMINTGVVNYCKCTDMRLRGCDSGVLCMYCNRNDIDAHRKIIEFMVENNMIQRTKDGRLHNISFKLNEQTRNKEYGNDFNSDIKLGDFVDLYTGEWDYGHNFLKKVAYKAIYGKKK